MKACGVAVLMLLFAASSAHGQSVASLFTTLPSDFAHLFTPTNGLIAGIGGAGSLAVHPKDDEIADDLYEASGGRRDFFRAGASIGDGVEQNAFALGTYIVGRVWRKPRVAEAGANLVDAQIVNGVLTQGIKYASDRRRPDGGARAFPSGHTSATFATAEVLREHFGWKWGAPAYAVGAYVSVSRMVDNKHWVSDVVFGTAIGLISGHAASLEHVAGRISIAPSFVPRGIAVVGSL